MSFDIIFWTYSEENQLVTNLFNVYHAIPPKGPGLFIAEHDVCQLAAQA